MPEGWAEARTLVLADAVVETVDYDVESNAFVEILALTEARADELERAVRATRAPPREVIQRGSRAARLLPRISETAATARRSGAPSGAAARTPRGCHRGRRPTPTAQRCGRRRAPASAPPRPVV